MLRSERRRNRTHSKVEVYSNGQSVTCTILHQNIHTTSPVGIPDLEHCCALLAEGFYPCALRVEREKNDSHLGLIYLASKVERPRLLGFHFERQRIVSCSDLHFQPNSVLRNCNFSSRREALDIECNNSVIYLHTDTFGPDQPPHCKISRVVGQLNKGG